jgi:pimeloyl-ACP methyl ester carboxylesterase
MPPNPGRSLPDIGVPTIPENSQILIYLHGGSSRLEEGVRFFDALLEEGTRLGRSYAVIAMDLLNSGYSTPVDHLVFAGGGSSYHPSGGDTNAAIPAWPAATYGYPMMDTEEQFILNFIDALDTKFGNIKNRITAVMGGSLGGNMAMRLGRRANTSPFLSTVVAWSVTCLGGYVGDILYDLIKGDLAGCGGDMVSKYMAEEAIDSRSKFFSDLYEQPVASCALVFVFIGNQPDMWYGNSWQCKSQAILLSEFDRWEYYTPQYRRWTNRLNFEMAVYYFQEGDLFVSPGGNHPRGPNRYLTVNSRLLLASGEEDNYSNVNIYDNTKNVAQMMTNTPGKALLLARTGHSIYEERPKLFAERVVGFLSLPAFSGQFGLWGISAGGGKVVIVGQNGTILLSNDGMTWVRQPTNLVANLLAVTWFAGFEGVASQFVALGDGILTSTDGASWSVRKVIPPEVDALSRIASGFGMLVVTSASGPHVYTSFNGIDWTIRDNVAPKPLLAVAWGRGEFVAVGYGGTIVQSTNGVAWTSRNAPTTDQLGAIVWSGSQYVVGGLNGTILTSADGVTWNQQASPTPNQINALTWSGSQFTGVTNAGEVIQSTDGLIWTVQPVVPNRLLNVIWWDGVFIAVGDSGAIITSPDGSTWKPASLQ